MHGRGPTTVTNAPNIAPAVTEYQFFSQRSEAGSNPACCYNGKLWDVPKQFRFPAPTGLDS